MKWTDVSEELAARLRAIGGVSVYAWPPGKVTAPAVVVGYPEEVTYDETYGRGMDTISAPVVVVAARAGGQDASARDALAGYLDGAGPRSVKAAIEVSGSAASGVFDVVRVAGADVDVISIGGIEYVAAVFDVEIAGSGSA